MADHLPQSVAGGCTDEQCDESSQTNNTYNNAAAGEARFRPPHRPTVTQEEDDVKANQLDGNTKADAPRKMVHIMSQAHFPGETFGSEESSDVSSVVLADEEQGIWFEEDLAVRPDGEEVIMTLSPTDLEVLQKLSDVYQEGMEQNQIGYMARYKSIKKFATGSVVCIMILQVLGITYFIHGESQMTLEDAVLFSTYTITSAGFGSIAIPHTTSFLMFVIVYLFVGITFLAVVVAQTYQFWMFRKDRVKHSIDKIDGARLGLQQLQEMNEREGTDNVLDKWPDPASLTIRNELVKSLSNVVSPSSSNTTSLHSNISSKKTWQQGKIQVFARRVSRFLRTTEMGNFMKVSFWLTLPLLILTIGMMILEGWSYVEGLYFSTFCMFTVGYGDYYPTTTASKWFVSFMLPCNILFVGLYLSNVAHYFVLLSNANIRRIEHKYQQNKLEDDIKVSRWRNLIETMKVIDPSIIPAVDDDQHKLKQIKTREDDDVVVTKTLELSDLEVGPIEKDNNKAQGSEKQEIRQRRERRQRVKELSNLSAMLMEQKEFEEEQQKESHNVAKSMNDEKTSNSPSEFETMADMISSVKKKAEEAMLCVTSREVEADLPKIDGDGDTLLSSSVAEESKTHRSIPSISELTNAQVFGREIERSTLLDSAFIGRQHQTKLQQAADALLVSSFAANSSTMGPSGPDMSSSLNKKPPTFVTRVLVQERLAYILARDVAGFECDHCEIKQQVSSTKRSSADRNNQSLYSWSLVLSKKFLMDVAIKRSIPPLARPAFCTMAMEALFFVGEHRLLMEGPKALLESLTPQEYAALTNPFLVAMGDVGSVWTSWLESTRNVMKEVTTEGLYHSNNESSQIIPNKSSVRSFRGGSVSLNSSSLVWKEQSKGNINARENVLATKKKPTERNTIKIKPRRIVKEEPVDDYFPPNQGNATLLEHRSNM